ncbi:MAG TPA: hypothetical protein VNM38_01410 [Solirubrobacterales bacterium]|nr:hypothetical protein [Solirubrobacterales bacterium]
MSLEPRDAELRITLISDDEVKKKCLRFAKGALPTTPVDGYLSLRGKGGKAVVRGYRSGTADGDRGVRGHSKLVKKVNGSASAEELKALIEPIGWWRYLPRAGWRSWLQVLVALVVLGAAAFALAEKLFNSEASTFVRYGVFGFGVLAAAAAFVAAAAKALRIKPE